MIAVAGHRRVAAADRSRPRALRVESIYNERNFLFAHSEPNLHHTRKLRILMQETYVRNLTMSGLRGAIIIVMLTADFGVAPFPAEAHAHLDHASPAADSVIPDAPEEVRIWFTQALEPNFTTAQLQSSSGVVVATGAVDAAEPKQVVIRVHGLTSGAYMVIWKAVSMDTHRTEGSFGFEVRP
jgi:methionine-rich copper-binding protein CopC